MTQWNRRQFLGAGLVAGLGAMGLRRFPTALASGGKADRYFIFCYFGGGWDTLLGLDPRDPALFTDADVGDTRIHVGYDRLQDPAMAFGADPRVQVADDVWFGPYIGDLANHFADLAVVRGMSMETLGHSGGRQRFITGKLPSGNAVRGSSATTHLAALLGADESIAQLSVGVESHNLDQPAFASALRVGSVPDLLATLRPAPTDLNDAEKRQIAQLLADAASCPDAQRSRLLVEAEAARAGVEGLVASGLDARFDFGADTAEMAALRTRYGFATNGLSTPEAQGALAVTAITAGVSRCATIRVANGLDTHGDEWSTNQGPRQRRGFNVIARMIEDLKDREYGDTGHSWFEHTTIVGFSEFSRTSRINVNGGRDHALTNACVLAGGGIQGGQILGRSSDVGLAPFPTNLASGLPDEDGELIHPEHVHRALLLNAGITEDVMDVRVEPLTALLAG
jgi:uncharacterized protein (DUF1501 family)